MPHSSKQLTAALLAHALSLPEAWEDHPWGENVAKVGKKVFVFFGVPDPRGEQLMVCVKLPRSGVSALDLGYTEPAGYGLGKSGWIMARIGPGERADLERWKGWIEESYRAIAPKKLVALLDGAPAKPAPAARKRKSARRK
ncbi:MAG: MmcQ/YjbR family DNA-binding protein [Planctomycetes bacterium]|nr:MmcQ/YjbR family DNA-binding protein [Planctomycetota bacterium]